MLIGGGSFIIFVLIYLMLCGDAKEVEPDSAGDDVGEAKNGTELDTQKEEKKQGGKSFKSLKQSSKKKIKKGTSGPDPQHASFMTGLKGIMSPLVDADFYESEKFLFVLAGESDSR